MRGSLVRFIGSAIFLFPSFHILGFCLSGEWASISFSIFLLILSIRIGRLCVILLSFRLAPKVIIGSNLRKGVGLYLILLISLIYLHRRGTRGRRTILF